MEQKFFIPGHYSWHLTVSIEWNNEHFKNSLMMSIHISDTAYLVENRHENMVRFYCRNRYDLLKIITLLNYNCDAVSLVKLLTKDSVFWFAQLEGKRIQINDVDIDIVSLNHLFGKFEHVKFWEEIRKLGWHELLPEK